MAPLLHGGGQGFESPRLHSNKMVLRENTGCSLNLDVLEEGDRAKRYAFDEVEDKSIPLE
ncbi:MAG: hypothetical protein AVDCRST_MAG93-6714, partial [uncultured Chloroflexia bacterium]